MKEKNYYLGRLFAVVCLSVFISSSARSEDNIIQQEKMSFDTCLKVIETSESKLSIQPTIADETDKKRVAVFKLIDGTLTITCNGRDELVTVSTRTN